MIISMINKRKEIWFISLLAPVLLIVGCSAIQPYHPPNHREEGPAKGLFTGSEGEWAIYGPKAPQKGGEEKKNTGQPVECEDEQKKPPKKLPADER